MDTMVEHRDKLYECWNNHYEELKQEVPSIESYKEIKNSKVESKSRRVFITKQFNMSIFRGILLLFKDFRSFLLDMFLIFAVGFFNK
jgi:hypothetical protein